MAKPKNAVVHVSKDQLRFEHRERALRIEKRYTTLRTAIVVAGGVAVAAYVYKSVAVIAGTTTTFVAIISSIVKFEISKYLGYAFGTVTGTAWWKERKLRKQSIEDMGAHIKKLESEKGFPRISSGLRADGQPNKEDKDVA